MLNKLVFVFSLLRASQGAVPYLCQNEFIEANRGSDAIFTCIRLDQSKQVQWEMNGQLLSSCPPFSSEIEETCDKSIGSNSFSAKRTSESSNLRVGSSELSKQTTISCSIPETRETAICTDDLIYPANDSSCHVKVNKDTNTVSTHCHIKKAYSAHGRYRCHLYQALQNETKETFLTSSAITTSPISGTDFVSGVCQMTSRLPPGDIHRYRVMITPGSVTVTDVNVTDDDVSVKNVTVDFTASIANVTGGYVDVTDDDVNVTLGSKNVAADVGSVTSDYTNITAGFVSVTPSYVNVTNSNDNISNGYPGDVSITTDNADVIRYENVTSVTPDYVSVTTSLTSQTFVLKEMNGSATTTRRDIAGWIAGGVCGGLLLMIITGVVLFCFKGSKEESTTPTTRCDPPASSTPETSAPKVSLSFLLTFRGNIVRPHNEEFHV